MKKQKRLVNVRSQVRVEIQTLCYKVSASFRNTKILREIQFVLFVGHFVNKALSILLHDKRLVPVKHEIENDSKRINVYLLTNHYFP
jgi:hypothetical protein